MKGKNVCRCMNAFMGIYEYEGVRFDVWVYLNKCLEKKEKCHVREPMLE